MEQVDVIIPAYKPGEKYLKLIDMLLAQTYPVHRIIVMNTEEKYYQKLRYDHPRMKTDEKIEVNHLSVNIMLHIHAHVNTRADH